MQSRWYLFVGIIIALVAGKLICFAWIQTLEVEESAVSQLPMTHAPTQPPAPIIVRPHPSMVKGIYLTAYTAANAKKMQTMIDLIDRTELNAVVIDIKDYTGNVLYDSHVPLVVELGNSDNRLGDVAAMIRTLHDHDIYVIARQTVFQDPVLARKKTEWAIGDVHGGLWRDKNGLSWVDASIREVWDYNIAIAKEAAGLGFDEVNFDYVRFPSDGLIRNMVLHTTSTKHDVMHDFYHTLGVELKDEPIKISVDLFGYVMERGPNDDLGIGQRLVDAVDAVDYVSPMMYPSHYPAGHLGLANPAAYPALVLTHGLDKGLPVFAGHRAQVRPWIQAFNMGAIYDGAMIRSEIDTVEKYETNGWLMWNAANTYTDAGLLPSPL